MIEVRVVLDEPSVKAALGVVFSMLEEAGVDHVAEVTAKVIRG